jgi:hypothetical protein
VKWNGIDYADVHKDTEGAIFAIYLDSSDGESKQWVMDCVSQRQAEKVAGQLFGRSTFAEDDEGEEE